MTVEIPPEHEQFVKAVLARGEFQTEGQVISEALRLLEERDRRLEQLRRDIKVGLDQLDRGEFTDYDEQSLKAFFEQIKVEGRKASARAKAADESFSPIVGSRGGRLGYLGPRGQRSPGCRGPFDRRF